MMSRRRDSGAAGDWDWHRHQRRTSAACGSASGIVSDATLATGELASLQTFAAPNTRIADLDGLEAAVNLRRLELRNNRIDDI